MKTIKVSNELYENLLSKRQKKLYLFLSELLERIKQTDKNSILSFGGIIDDERAKEFQNRVKRVGKNIKARV